jgi:hypothetical protein
MRLFKTMFRKNQGGTGSDRRESTGSKFEHFDFGPGRFECSLRSLSHTGTCEDLFLNHYTKDELMALIGRAGITELCASKGYHDPLITLRTDDSQIHHFKLYDGKETPGRLLMALSLSELGYRPDPAMTGSVIDQRRYNALAIEWLMMQSPRDRFNAERPRLPGQEHPGLGGVDCMTRLMENLAGDLAASAVLDVPSHFHAAVMYSRRFHFTDPAQEGMILGVLHDLGVHSLADLSWAFVTGSIFDADTGDPVPYKPSEQILPVDESLARYLTSRTYRQAVEHAMNSRHYSIDLDTMKKMRKNIKI